MNKKKILKTKKNNFAKYERIYKNEKVLKDFNIPKTILGNAYSLSEGPERYIMQQLLYKRDAEIESGRYAIKKNEAYIINYLYALEKIGYLTSELEEKFFYSSNKQMNISKFLPKLGDWYESKKGILSQKGFQDYLIKDINEGLDEYLFLNGGNETNE